jgi:hypothetical protein
MSLRYKDAVHIEKGSLVSGWLTPAYVFSWAEDDDTSLTKPVRVHASERVVRNWGINWFRAHDVEAAFRARRNDWLANAGDAKDDGRDFRVFEIPV